ncbi:MAG: GtrA family protein [Blautia sp.]|nr:GtrA family protein [Lachnoclostridium sp.]MCM1211741.1 GtrA family protein [Blautia sp.]
MKKLFQYCWDLYKKYEEGINYLIFGFLAFVLNYVLYYVFESLLHTDYMWATAISWVLTVVFAYWTNRTFVFKSKNQGKQGLLKEFGSFIGARIATEVLELVLMYLMVDIAGINSYVAKLIAQVAVIVTNYFLSKLWIFKEKK